MSGDAPTSGEETQITCKFVTRLPEEYRISPTPFAVPGKLTRYGLSEVINHLLALDPPKPFDFLVDGELVRTSLEKLLLRKGISAESTLDVEYIPAVGPPSPEATGAHEDWVSAVDGGWAPAVATGCYDGAARLSPQGSSRGNSPPATGPRRSPPSRSCPRRAPPGAARRGRTRRRGSIVERLGEVQTDGGAQAFRGTRGRRLRRRRRARGRILRLRGGTTELFACGAARAWRVTAGETLEKPSRSSSDDVKPPAAPPREAGANRRASNLPPNPPKR